MSISFVFSNSSNQESNFAGFDTTKVSFIEDGSNPHFSSLKNGFVILSNDRILETRNNIDKKENWAEIMQIFLANYSDTELDDGYYKWGQVVPEDGEFLCKDCGYILDLKEGDIFPICEVCLSGEPEGPSTPSQGYWEKI